MSLNDFLNYEIVIKVMTPVHIGGTPDGELNKDDYIVDIEKKTIHVIDNKKFVMYLSSKGLIETYANYIKTNVGEHQKNQLDLGRFIRTHCNLSPNMLKQMFRLSIPIPKGINNVNDVSLFTRNGLGEIFIPGSSIKGALRNCIIGATVKENSKFLDEKTQLIRETSKRIIGKKEISEIARNIEQKVFNNNAFKPTGITVSDTYENLNVNTKLYIDIDHNIEKDEERTIPKYREYLSIGSKLKFSLKIDKHFASAIGINDIDSITKIITKTNENMFDKGVFSHMRRIKEFLPRGYENCIILGSNTGFHQKTILNHLFTDRRTLLETTKKILHKKDGDKIRSHNNDKNYSPRILNLIEVEGKKMLAGFVAMEVKEV